MTDPEKPPNTPMKALATNTNPESPTTARPLDFDDEPQEAGVISQTPSKPSSQSLGNKEAPAPPPKPPRPLSPRQEAQNTLKEAFPDVDMPVIKAVLTASGYNVERAFHALLGMSDPNAQEEMPPMKPPRPSSTTQRQLEADEMYARQLAEHYSGAGQRRDVPRSSWDHEPRLPRQKRETGLKPNELYDDREHNFFDDDLPVIRENIRKGFLETQSRVNTWVQNFKKHLDGDDSEDEYAHVPPRQADDFTRGYGEAQTHRTRRSNEARRSGDRERYDADPQVLGDDFSGLELRDDEAPPPRPARPTANPDLFKSKSSSPGRKVSFQEGPPEEISNTYSGRSPPPGSKASKWQPLTTVDPSPVGDNDPFSLGDSDDEKEVKNKDLKGDEAERVKKATAEAMAGDIGDESKSKGDSKDKPAGGS